MRKQIKFAVGQGGFTWMCFKKKNLSKKYEKKNAINISAMIKQFSALIIK